ncbi:hypothetical protein DV736_g4181, partial [Chaetothyriales sp. CBS 134916]
MAGKIAQIGSAAWISAEKENVRQLLQEEKEELVFPAQHEIEWLNEHMEEIFSKRHVYGRSFPNCRQKLNWTSNMTNVFKTPGKMKGKTPRTNRKRVVGETRMPLTDVFTSQSIKKQSQSPVRPLGQRRPPPKFEIAQDASEPPKRQLPSQADSGYQGSSQSPTEADERPAVPPRSSLRTGQTPQSVARPRQERERTTDGSFHSAKEDQTTKIGTPQEQAQITKDNAAETADLDMEDIGSPSDESTPDRPLVRKGSLTFASLPAREPLKTSIGARISRTSHSIHQNLQPQPGCLTQMREHDHAIVEDHHHIENNKADDHDGDYENVVMEDSHIETHGRDESEDESQPIRLPNKTAAQRLHDKLEQLGKAPARTSKSIPSFMAATGKSSAAPPVLHHTAGLTTADDEDDWIKPLTSPEKHITKATVDEADAQDEFDVRAPELIAHEERMKTPVPSPSPRPGFVHTKSHSTTTLTSPAKASMAPPSPGAKSISVSNPAAQPTTTPQDSPRRYLDLSASKQKLHSIMKTAKSLFTNSAGVSAAAKQEVLSPCAVKSASNDMPGVFPQTNRLHDKPLPPIGPQEGRRMRSSTEREREDRRRQKETRARQKMNDDLEKARWKEAQKAGLHKAAASPQKHTEPNLGETHKGTQTARVAAGHAAKARPAPVAIKVGMQRMPAGSSIANSKQETLPAEPRRPRLTKKASITSISSQSTTNLKTSVHTQVAKPKALLAAERKKLQDEQEAARKLEQKREMERRRQAQQEEARKQQEEKRAEEERRERERVAAEHAKRQAQQQAIEKKRQEAVRKAEQQRLERERAAAEASRPPSRLGSQQPAVGRSLINHPLPTNPAKPPKRPVEEDSGRPQAAKFGAVSQQQDAKRRKTDEDEQSHRPTMSGAPIRQSNLSKKPSIFNHTGYAPPAQPSQLTQFPPPPSRAQPPQMSQFAHQKIPFADAPNPPAHSNQSKPSTSIRQVRTIQAVKSSPQFPHGEQIQLPEIPTDSEDEDSDDEANAFSIPDWATPGHLTEQLMRQEGVDGDAVFGPIAPLKMEEIFSKGNKERLKRLRDRTSSANWTMSGDGLTLEEVRADREQRERIRLDGGWQYGGCS